MHPSNKEPLELSQAMKDSHNLWDNIEPEVFKHEHLGNLLEVYGPSKLPRENPSPETLAITKTINHLIEREDFKNTDSWKILDAYLSATTKDFLPEANKLLNKSLSFYFKNFNKLDSGENLINLTNLFQVAASKTIISVDEQNALGEDFLKSFEKIKEKFPSYAKEALQFILLSTSINKIDDKKYSNFISENLDLISELISQNPIFIINNLDAKKINIELENEKGIKTNVKDELQPLISAEIRTQKHLLGIQGSINPEQIFQNPQFTKFARMVLAAADKAFISENELNTLLPEHEKIRSAILIDYLNSLADKTSSIEAEKDGIDGLLKAILNKASEEEEVFNPQVPCDLFTLNLEIISTLQDVREKDPTYFRSLITQSLDPDRLILPDEFEDDAINPFNHLLLTKAFCDPTCIFKTDLINKC